MFGGPPKGYEPTEAERDLGARMVPSDEQRAEALTIIRRRVGEVADSWAKCRVVAPLAFPGKVRGVWTVGQEVAHPPGLWVHLDAGTDQDARALAEQAAALWLGDRAGTVGYAYIWLQDGADACAVFEGF